MQNFSLDCLWTCWELQQHQAALAWGGSAGRAAAVPLDSPCPHPSPLSSQTGLAAVLKFACSVGPRRHSSSFLEAWPSFPGGQDGRQEAPPGTSMVGGRLGKVICVPGPGLEGSEDPGSQCPGLDQLSALA